jgi:hypothetical protein
MPRRIVMILSGLAVVFILGTSSPARAELPRAAGSVWGGEVDITNRGALSVGLGWPAMFVRYDFHTSGSFGIGVRGDFVYGNPIGWFHFGAGTAFSVPMRIQVMDRNQWAMSLELEPGVFFGFDDDWARYHPDDDDAIVFGPNFTFGLIASVSPRRFITIFFGMRIATYFFIYAWEDHESTWEVFVPINPFGGVEVQVHRSISIFAFMQVGPGVRSYYHCDDWDGDRGDMECRDWDRDTEVGFSGKLQFGATFWF